MAAPLPLILAAAAGGLLVTAGAVEKKRRADRREALLKMMASPGVRRWTAAIVETAQQRERDAAMLQAGARFVHLIKPPKADAIAELSKVFEMFRPLIKHQCPQCLTQASAAEAKGDVLGMTRALWSAIARNGLGMTTKTTQNPDDIVGAVTLAAALAKNLYSVRELVDLAHGFIARPRVLTDIKERTSETTERMKRQLASTARYPVTLVKLLAQWGLEASDFGQPPGEPIVVDVESDRRGRFYWELFL